MKVFGAECAQFEAERQELANAERLFDLPITMYPELFSVQKIMKGLELIYELYKRQKVSMKFLLILLLDLYLSNYLFQLIIIVCLILITILMNIHYYFLLASYSE